MTATLPARLVVFLAIAGVAAAVVLPVAYAYSGWIGVRAAGGAASACILPGLVVLLLQERFKQPQWAMATVAAGFLVRMGFPLAVCMAVYWRGGPLVEAGFVFYLLVFYMVELAVGTVLALPREAWSPRKYSNRKQ